MYCGSLVATKRKNDRMPASLVFRLRALFPRRVSMSLRKSATSSTSRSSTASFVGGLPVFTLA
jgi:hypothetical protein